MPLPFYIPDKFSSLNPNGLPPRSSPFLPTFPLFPERILMPVMAQDTAFLLRQRNTFLFHPPLNFLHVPALPHRILDSLTIMAGHALFVDDAGSRWFTAEPMGAQFHLLPPRGTESGTGSRDKQ